MDAILITGRRQKQLALVANTAQETPPLRAGVFDVWCDQDVWIRVGELGVAGDTSTDNPALSATSGYKIFAGNVVPVLIERDNEKIGAFATADATFSYHRTA